MARSELGSVVRRLERLLHFGSVAGLSEGQLLEKFVARRDPEAFEALLARHGPMVIGVCRQWLSDPHDVEDAFQATFLVLVKKAGTLRDRDLVGNWLYGVAYRVALRARGVGSRRRARETSGVEEVAGPGDPSREESRPWLHEEIRRLPDKYRMPVVLCYLEGLTHEEAADQLHWPVGTVKGRLARAREVLRSRLSRRGLTLSAGVLVASLARDASAAVPRGLLESTTRAATDLAAGHALAAGSVSATAVALMEGVTNAMFWNKMKLFAVSVLAAGLLTTGAGTLAFQHNEKAEPKPAAAPVPAPDPGPRDMMKAQIPARTKAKTSTREGRGGSSAGATATSGSAGGRDPYSWMTTGVMPQSGMMPMMPGAMGGPGESEMLRTIAQASVELEALDKDPKTQALFKKLNQPLVMSFSSETPLEEVLKYIRTATTGAKDAGIPIYVDPVGLREVNQTIQSTIVIELEGVPIRTTLRLMLKQLGLAYCVRDGVLIISSVKGIHEELMEFQSRQEAEEDLKEGVNRRVDRRVQ